jgi:hypothetical protein
MEINYKIFDFVYLLTYRKAPEYTTTKKLLFFHRKITQITYSVVAFTGFSMVYIFD